MAPKKTRAELMRDIDAAYYGFRDDEDGLLVPLEVEAEKVAIETSLKRWKEKKLKRDLEAQLPPEDMQKATDNKKKRSAMILQDESLDEDILKVPEMSESDRLQEAMEAGKETRYISYIVVPSQDDIKEALLRRKKQELLMQYDLEDDEQKEQQNNG